MVEEACQFGENNRLTGVLTKPDDDRPTSIAFILITAGLLPKVGPYRLYTLLARKLAELGFLVLRFDLGGIGESRQTGSSLSLTERTSIDIREALRFVEQKTGATKFILGGLCSGAEDAFNNAAENDRVVGVLMIDPHGYRTRKYYIYHFIYRLTRRTLRALGIYKPFSYTQQDELHNMVEQIGYRDFLPRDVAAKLLQKLVNRNVKIHYIYTGGAQAYFNHKQQLYDMFSEVDMKDVVKLNQLSHIGHTPVLKEDREDLVDIITDWAKSDICV